MLCHIVRAAFVTFVVAVVDATSTGFLVLYQTVLSAFSSVFQRMDPSDGVIPDAEMLEITGAVVSEIARVVNDRSLEVEVLPGASVAAIT